MSTQLLRTKLFVPKPRPGLVRRTRLAERLTTGLRGKLTLLSAPAGYGKTTLLSEWIDSSNHTVAWLSLDGNDEDPIRFLSCFIAALRHVDHSIGVDVQDALEAAQNPPLETLLTLLINEIVSCAKEFIVVLDDCHLVTIPPTYDILDFLLLHLPPNMRLVISGRVDPPLSLSRLRADGQLTEIRSDDLRFTMEEAATFLNDLMALDLSSADVTALEARTEGWIAGLQLVALSLQKREEKHAFVAAFSGSHRYIIDYLLDEVMSQQSPEIQAFLRRTSILRRFCSSLCDEVVGIANSGAIIRYLETTNLFLIPLDDDRNWYRYHHLFADSLEQWLREDDPESIPELRLRAARWLERNGFLDEAMGHTLEGQLLQEAASLVERHGMQLLERSELAKLMRWMDELSQELIHQRPWLCICLAWALRLTGAPFETVEARLAAAEQIVQEYGWTDEAEHSLIPAEAHRMLGHIAAIRAYQALYREEFPLVEELAHQALKHRPHGSFVRSSIALALGWAYRFSGDLGAALGAFDEAREIGVASGNTYLAVAATCRAAHAEVLRGQLRRARARYHEALGLATREDGRRLPVAGYANVYLGGICREWNDLDAAERYLSEGITSCERVGYIMDQVVGQVNLARVRQAQGDWAAARQALEDADHLSQMMKSYVYVRRWVEDSQVRVWLAQGDLDSAARWATTSDMGVYDDLSFSRELEHIILARVLVHLGREQQNSAYIQDALLLLGRLLEMAESAGWWGKAIEILVLRALALQACGSTEEALQHLQRVLPRAAMEGYVRTFLDEGSPMAALLSMATSQGIATDYAGSLLAAFQSRSAGEQAASPQPLIEPLSKRELEVLRLLNSDLSGPEIALELTIALTTFRFHTRNIYGKLGVNSRRSAVRRAQELDLL